METWEHMTVAAEKSGNISQLVSTTSTGSKDTIQSTGLVATLTMLDQLGQQGWQLVSVDQGIHWLKRPRETPRTGRGSFL